MGLTSHELKQELAKTSQEILKLRAELQATKKQAKAEGLTGLLNRECFDKELLRLCHDEQPSFTLALFDTDNFKQINDRLVICWEIKSCSSLPVCQYINEAL